MAVDQCVTHRNTAATLFCQRTLRGCHVVPPLHDTAHLQLCRCQPELHCRSDPTSGSTEAHSSLSCTPVHMPMCCSLEPFLRCTGMYQSLSTAVSVNCHVK